MAVSLLDRMCERMCNLPREVANISEFELDNSGNSEAQQKQATSYLFPQSALGVAADGVLTGLVVTQNTTADVNVRIDAGAAVVQNARTDGASLLVCDTIKTLNVLTGNPVGGLPRYDLVVFDSVTAAITVIVGTPNASPSDPTVPATALALARLRHGASAVTIPTANIDDLRKYTTLAGAPIPVANQAARDALTAVPALRVDRLDLDRIERYSGTVWQPVSGKMPHRSLIRSGVLNVNPTGVEVPITAGWSADADDGGDACGITYSGGILTVAFAGVYAVNASLMFTTSTVTGSRIVSVRKNGNTTPILKGGCQGGTTEEVATTNRRVKLAAGDTLQPVAYQSSGANGTVIVAVESFWQVTYICPA